MKRFRWQLVILFLALTTIVVLTLTSSEPIVSEPEAVEPEPVTGGVYVEALIGSFSRLNPLLDYYNDADRSVDRLLFNSLITFDSRGLPNESLVESFGISRDGMVYNFALRTDVEWHDGEQFDSEDIAYTISLLQDPNLPIPQDIKDLWADIEVTAINEYTIQFRLPEPFAPFLDYLTFGILPEHLLSGVSAQALIDDPFNLQPVGTGPYVFDRWIAEGDSANGLVLTANDEYFEGRPFIDEWTFRYYSDQQSAYQAYQAGDVMGISQLSGDVLEQALEVPELNIYTGRVPQLTLIYLNLDNPQVPFFQDLAIREILYQSINRRWIVNRILNGQASIANGPIFPNTWAYYEGILQVDYNPDLALERLIENGYTIPAEGGNVRSNADGQFLEFTLAHPDDPTHSAIAQAIQEDWNALGMEVTLQPLPYEELISERLESRLYEAALVDLDLSRLHDPDPYPFWHQTQATGGQNYAIWNDRQASEYLEQGRINVFDFAERTRLYRNFQVRFANELPALPLYYPMYSFAVQQQVRGVQTGPIFEPADRYRTVNEWFIYREGDETPTPEQSAETPQE